MPRKAQPYVMPGRPRSAEPRPTSVDPADPRIPTVYPPRLAPEQLRVMTREGAMDPRLRSTDRCFQRWGATPGSAALLPLLARVRLDVSARASHAPPLNDDEARLVDDAVRTADPPESRFVTLWYRTGATVTEIAALLGMKRRQAVYEERRLVLSYFRGRLQVMGLPLPMWTAEP